MGAVRFRLGSVSRQGNQTKPKPNRLFKTKTKPNCLYELSVFKLVTKRSCFEKTHDGGAEGLPHTYTAQATNASDGD